MIISDINYLEATNEEVVGGFHKTVDISVDVDFDFDVDVDVDVNKQYDIDLDSDLSIEGNFAELVFDVTASGSNTYAEADVSVLATGGLSEIGGIMTAAVG
ncbi:MAG: hypothetical protein AAFV71_21025 [Cyanobacteria bacterium J06633_8]